MVGFTLTHIYTTRVSKLVKLFGVDTGSIRPPSGRIRWPLKVIFSPVFYHFLPWLHILHNVPIE